MMTGAQTVQSLQFFPGKANSRLLSRDGPMVFPRTPKLMDELHVALRSRHYSGRTEQAYCRLVRRFIFFSNVRHPEAIGAAPLACLR
jgi:hypothetical protein